VKDEATCTAGVKQKLKVERKGGPKLRVEDADDGSTPRRGLKPTYATRMRRKRFGQESLLLPSRP
jgi:hypothetical protein